MTRKSTTVTDASDPGQINAAEDYAKDKARDLEFILNRPRGRRFLWGIINDICHHDAVTLSPAALDTNAMLFNEGARQVGVRLRTEAQERFPALYLKMIEENLSHD
jgi:hypothetical protein